MKLKPFICLLTLFIGACSPRSSSKPVSKNQTLTTPTPDQPADIPDVPRIVGKVAMPNTTSSTQNSCNDIESAEDKLNLYTPTPSDLVCAQDTDCVFGTSLQNIGSEGPLMNQTAALHLKSQLDQLQASFTAMKCQPSVIMGSKAMSPQKAGICVNKVCQSQALFTCAWGVGTPVPSSNINDLGYCFQYRGLSSADQQTATTACSKIKDYGFDVEGYRSCISNSSYVGVCKFPATTTAPAVQVYYYSPNYTASTAQAACNNGMSPYTQGVWTAR